MRLANAEQEVATWADQVEREKLRHKAVKKHLDEDPSPDDMAELQRVESLLVNAIVHLETLKTSDEEPTIDESTEDADMELTEEAVSIWADDCGLSNEDGKWIETWDIPRYRWNGTDFEIHPDFTGQIPDTRRRRKLRR